MERYPITWMLVMEIDPESGRKYKHRIFVDLMANEQMDSDRVKMHEKEEARKQRVSFRDVLTLNVVKLQ